MNIGELVRTRRKELNMTQVELAEDICTQAMVSKIEQGLINPSSQLIKKVADRLSISVSYFYEDEMEEIEIQNLEKDIRFLLHKQDVKELRKVLKDNKEKFYNSEKEDHILFYDISVEMTKYLDTRDEQRLLNYLTETLVETAPAARFYPNILSLIGIAYYIANDYDHARSYLEDAFAKMNDYIDPEIRARNHFFYSLTLEALGEIDEALEITNRTIEGQIRKQSLFLLGYLLNLKGRLLIKQEKHSEGLEALNHSLNLFELMDVQTMIPVVKDAIEKTSH